MRFGKQFLGALVSIFVAGNAFAADSLFPDGIYSDFSKAWQRAVFAIASANTPIPLIGCVPAKEQEFNNCVFGAKDLTVIVEGKDPVKGIGIKAFKMSVPNEEQASKLQATALIVATIINFSYSKDMDFVSDIHDALGGSGAKLNNGKRVGFVIKPDFEAEIILSEDGSYPLIEIFPKGYLAAN